MPGIVPQDIIREYNSTRNFLKRRKLCYAPFNALRFSLSGNIYACCYNRFHSLGKYPEVSVTEAWFGEKAEKLREAISQNDLSLGCHSCYSKLINRNFQASGSKIYDTFKEQKKGPSLLDFEISNTCNLECIMCNGENSSLIRRNREKGDPYPLVYDDDFVNQLDPFISGLKEARFVGGEPFLIDIYKKIWTRLSTLNKSIKINILTNGTVLNDEIIEFYKNNNVHVSFSLDSINKETYESIRINARFENVMQNFNTIYQLSRQYKRDLTVNICPIRKNMWEIPDMVNHYTNLNIPIVLHIAVYPSAEVIGTMSTEKLQEYLNFLSEVKIQTHSFISKANYTAFESYRSQVSVWLKKAIQQPEIITQSISELQISLAGKLKNYLCELDIQDNLRLSKYNELIARIVDEINNPDTARTALKNLIAIDAGYIVSELETSSFEKIKERFIALGGN
ncbi:MAG: hypothetical protein CVU05_03295 [Bacteroidetes bacterium HGW-Bacteroidetes-21]|nr:MAG: hypothetical protein CVU05_03295 [Bacteroidetes bacterium HGW-Bacteroidetes-21]